MDYDNTGAIPNALLQPDGSITALDGAAVDTAGAAAEWRRMSPIPNKLLRDDGSITTLDGTPVDVSQACELWRSMSPIPDKTIDPDGSIGRLTDVIGAGGGGEIDLAGNYPIGRIVAQDNAALTITAGNNIWLACDGREITAVDYPGLIAVMPIDYITVSPVNMTANNAPAPFAASAGTAASGYAVFRAFHEDINQGYRSTSTANIQWIGLDFAVPAHIDGYRIYNGSGSETFNFRDFALNGSDNGADWTVIDTVYDRSTAVFGITEHYLAKPAVYRFYRLTTLEPQQLRVSFIEYLRKIFVLPDMPGKFILAKKIA